MLTGLYHAASALRSSEQQHEVISQNLAHAQMPGYRRLTARSGNQGGDFGAELDAASQGGGNVSVDFSQGPLVRTDRTLDVALQGDGFFVVEGPGNKPLYTRNGTFRLDENGKLQTLDGMAVQGENGPIEIPESAPFGSISIGEDGVIRVGRQQIDKLKLADFKEQDRAKLVQAGVTLFAAPGSAAPEEATPAVLQYMREGSNVSPILELVSMIEAQRRYEAAQKSISLLSDSVQRHIDQR